MDKVGSRELVAASMASFHAQAVCQAARTHLAVLQDDLCSEAPVQKDLKSSCCFAQSCAGLEGKSRVARLNFGPLQVGLELSSSNRCEEDAAAL
eukprot:4969606-Pyramimonas_sp.AAC.1